MFLFALGSGGSWHCFAILVVASLTSKDATAAVPPKLMRSNYDWTALIEPGAKTHLTAQQSQGLTAAFAEQVQGEISEENDSGSLAMSGRMLLPDGEKVLRDFRASARKVCDSNTSVIPANEQSGYTLFKTDSEEGCGYASGRMHVLQNVQLAFSPEKCGVSFQMSCNMQGPLNISVYNELAAPETHGATFEITQRVPGESSPGLRQSARHCQEVQEDTILVINPRGEDFGNVYHDMEAVFGLLQTADVLKRPLYDFRILIVHGNVSSASPDGFLDLVQLEGQVDGSQQGNMSPGRSGMVPEMLPQLLELWSHLAQRPSGSKMQRLPSSISTYDGLCFTGRVVLPIHVCSGEILSRTWSSEPQVHRESPLALRYTQQILQAFQLDSLPSHIPASFPKNVLLLVRGKLGAQTRQMFLLDRQDLEDRLPKEAGVSVSSTDFVRLSYADQVRHTRNSSILVSTHGAGLTNLIFLPDNGGVLEITEWLPPYRADSVANIYWNLAAWTNKRYYSVRGDDRWPYIRFSVNDVISGVKELVKEISRSSS